MKFLLDQDVYAATARFLSGLNHDVVTVSEIGHARTADIDLLKLAHDQERIFVTRDRDFGGLVYMQQAGAGVVYLRLSPATLEAAHRELARVLSSHSEEELRSAFVVVEPGRHRFRRHPR